MITVETRSRGQVTSRRIYPPPEPQFPKTCRKCGPVTEAEWQTLPRIDDQVDDVWRLEFRHHTCGSTLAVIAEVYDPEALAAEEDPS